MEKVPEERCGTTEEAHRMRQDAPVREKGEDRETAERKDRTSIAFYDFSSKLTPDGFFEVYVLKKVFMHKVYFGIETDIYC